jgi:hypothetical protein
VSVSHRGARAPGRRDRGVAGWDSSNAKAVDQLIAQSGAVRDAQLSQLRAKEVEAAEKVRAANERVVAGLEADFDVPVRFDTDHMAVTIESYRMHNWQQIPIVELRT